MLLSEISKAMVEHFLKLSHFLMQFKACGALGPKLRQHPFKAELQQKAFIRMKLPLLVGFTNDF